MLIRSAAGDVRIEEEAQGPPVGGEVDLKREIKRTRLHPGDVLILITDGLVEGLDRDIDEALDQIAKALTEADPSTEAMLDQLFGMNEEGTDRRRGRSAHHLEPAESGDVNHLIVFDLALCDGAPRDHGRRGDPGDRRDKPDD